VSTQELSGYCRQCSSASRRLTCSAAATLDMVKSATHTDTPPSDPQRGLKTFTSNPVNSHELVAGGKGMQMMLVNTARGEIVTRVRLNVGSKVDILNLFTARHLTIT
jgi:hypothetical protein